MAKMKRTSILRGRTPPTRSTSRVSITRNSFTCSLRRQLAELVEEDRAAGRRLEQSGLRLRGAREGAAFVAEQLALEQRRRQRRAIDRQQRPGRARRRGVDRPRQYLFAEPDSPRMRTLMLPAAARSASACTRSMLSSTAGDRPAPAGAVVCRRRAPAPAERARGARRRDSWHAGDARRAADQPLRKRRGDAARGLAGQPRHQQRERARTTAAHDVDHPNRTVRDVRWARVRRRRHARDGERSAGRFGAGALPLDALLELGRPRAVARGAARAAIGWLHHQHQRTDRDRLAG